MIKVTEKPDIDANNKIERNIDGCKVRLFFSLQPNEKIKRLVLDNLMLCYDRKMQGGTMVQS